MNITVWDSPDEVPYDHLTRNTVVAVHHLNPSALYSKDRQQIDGQDFRFHIDINELLAYIKPKKWLQNSKLAVHVVQLGDEEQSVGLSLLYNTEESNESFETRCKIYQINTYRKARALANLTEQEELELYKRLKEKYGDH